MSLIDFGGIPVQNTAETWDKQAMSGFASHRGAAPNAGSEPKRNGPVELPETRRVHGTQ